MAGEWPRCASLARANWCRHSFGDRWGGWCGDRGIVLRGSPALASGQKARQVRREHARARRGRFPRPRPVRAAAEGRWGKRGARQGWAGATPRGKGWRRGLLPSLFAAGLRRTPLVAHFASSSAGRAGAGREWPCTPRPL